MTHHEQEDDRMLSDHAVLIRDLKHATSAVDARTSELSIEPLIASARTRGRRAVRRRRIATTVSAAAAVATLGGGAAVLAGPWSPDGQEFAASRSAPSDVTDTDSTEDAMRRSVDQMTALLLVRVRSLVPNGTTVRAATSTADPLTPAAQAPRAEGIGALEPLERVLADQPRTVAAQVVDSAGPALVTLTVDRSAPADARADAQRLCATGTAQCSSSPEGRLIVLADRPESTRGGVAGVRSTIVVLVTPDGASISAAAYNGPAEKEPANRTEPVLDADALTSLVSAPGWWA